jgi:EmrB/QacA subfamily drug resistance transporter
MSPPRTPGSSAPVLTVCAGVLMIVLDTMIVQISLPAIKSSLELTDGALAWLVNAYMGAFSGTLLLGGRLGDLYGQRRLFLLGIALFTGGSLVCGVATSGALLIVTRALQGVAGALALAVALGMIVNLTTVGAVRARAMSFYAFACAGGGTLGLLLGGLIVSYLSWHWIFLVNFPVGLALLLGCHRFLPPSKPVSPKPSLDVLGAATVTLGLMTAVYAIVNLNEAGLVSLSTLGPLAGSVVLLVLFVWIERRVRSPLVPLDVLRARGFPTANVVYVLWSAGVCGWSFVAVLYMQSVMGLASMEISLAYLPVTAIMAAFSLGAAARVVMRFGVCRTLCTGLFLHALGIMLFFQAPAEASAWEIVPAMAIIGLGSGVALNPLLLASMNGVPPSDSGLASGVLNTSRMVGGVIGVAVAASSSGVYSHVLLAGGAEAEAAVAGGYRFGLLVNGLLVAAAGVVAAVWLRSDRCVTPAGGPGANSNACGMPSAGNGR